VSACGDTRIRIRPPASAGEPTAFVLPAAQQPPTAPATEPGVQLAAISTQPVLAPTPLASAPLAPPSPLKPAEAPTAHAPLPTPVAAPAPAPGAPGAVPAPIASQSPQPTTTVAEIDNFHMPEEPAKPLKPLDPVEDWPVIAGKTVKSQLRDWSTRAHYAVSFDGCADDWEIEVADVIHASFPDAVTQLLRGFERSAKKPQAIFHPNRALELWE